MAKSKAAGPDPAAEPAPQPPPTVAVHCSFTEMRPLETLVENPRNPNTHSDEQIKLLGRVIAGAGWRSPIVVSRRSGFIVKGHGRFQAALASGMTHAPVDVQEYATEADEWADMIADNRLAEMAEVSSDALKNLLQEMDTGAFSMDLTGFEEAALADLMSQYNVAGIDAPTLADGDRAPFRQITFTVHDEQHEEVEAALKKAKAEDGGESAVNENSNGNALAWICGKFNRG